MGWKKNVHSGLSLVDAICNVVSTYRCSPHLCLGGRTPAKILHGREPKYLLLLCLASKTTEQEPNVAVSDKNSHFHLPKLSVDDFVFARNYATGSKWLPAKGISNLDNVLYSVRTDCGIWRRHQNQLQARIVSSNDFKHNRDGIHGKQPASPIVINGEVIESSNDETRGFSVLGTRRCPSRIRRPPDIFQAGF